MATDMNRIQGEIAENPQGLTSAGSDMDQGVDLGVQKLLLGFLQSLLTEVGHPSKINLPTINMVDPNNRQGSV